MLEDAVGGGISQVATTLYNAAFFAGLQLDAHTPHQFWISRYPKGREATVSFGGPELVFTNNWDAGILINAYAGSNSITIRFFSSPLGRRVETETGEDRDVVEPTTKETVNPDLEPGERVVEQSMGGAGFTVSYTRKVWAGDTLKSEQTFTWTYDPQNAYVEVGPPEKPSTSTAPGRHDHRARRRDDRAGHPTAPPPARRRHDRPPRGPPRPRPDPALSPPGRAPVGRSRSPAPARAARARERPGGHHRSRARVVVGHPEAEDLGALHLGGDPRAPPRPPARSRRAGRAGGRRGPARSRPRPSPAARRR